MKCACTYLIQHHSNVHRLFLGTWSAILSPCIMKTKRAKAWVSSFKLFKILSSQVWRFLRWEIKRFLAWLAFHTSRSFSPHVYFRRWRCVVVGAAMGASSFNFFLKNFIQAGFTVPSVISQINLTVLSCSLLFTWCLLGAEALVSCGLLEALLRVVEHQGGDSHLTVR